MKTKLTNTPFYTMPILTVGLSIIRGSFFDHTRTYKPSELMYQGSLNILPKIAYRNVSDGSNLYMMSGVGVLGSKGTHPFLQRVLIQNYLPESISLKARIIQKLRLLHSCSKEIALCYISQLLTVNFSLKGKNRNTPNGWGYLVIGS